MGVFHFMGLGRSPGAVTVALSYLAQRHARWNEADSGFFATSGELEQHGRPGDVQALVLFTTPEVREGRVLAQKYLDNQPGFSRGAEIAERPMREALYSILRGDLRALGGGRPAIELYWCDYDRARPTQTFERVARTLLAAKPPGKLGKEVWINLTGGTNVLNSAFELASALTGVPARMYYVLSDDIRCVRPTLKPASIGTADDTLWVELPIVNAALSQQHLAILLMLPNDPPGLTLDELYSTLKGTGVSFAHISSPVDLNRQYIVQLRAQKLAAYDEDTGGVYVGPQWPVLERYYEAIPEPVGTGKIDVLPLNELAEREDWFHRDEALALE